MSEIDRAQPQRCLALFLGQHAHRTRRVGWKTKGLDQREKRRVGHLPRSTKPVRMTRVDPDKPSDVLDRGAVVHVTGTGTPVPRLGEKQPNRSRILPRIHILCRYHAR